ncbi:DHH family phosphoesterase [Actinocatenispora comari]|uniref:Phosphoesterase n=1 Tax=Actinocatenispora comari TaxID=2807577 RepID=A0A8J4EJ68_9ACTN|nr:bifunctional oligoribonuclease/PAP phosphatase NrnA [Actinocatenispora comari]GIL25986.1 phosphoesterase [Actinocatenispora comari]
MTAPAPIAEADWAAALDRLRSAGSILLTCHLNPDGDALGSMLGAGLGLAQLGLPVRASFPSPFELTGVLAELPGRELLVPPGEAPAAPDLLVSFDASSVDRLGDLADRLHTAAHTLVFDHHASNPGFGEVNLVDPSAAATAVLVDELLRRLGVELTAPIAECLYVALSTDTGSFKFSATTQAVHELAGRLVATGIPHAELSRKLYDTRPFGALRLLADVLGRASLDPAAASGAGLVASHATLADLARHGQPPQVLETLIGDLRTAQEAEVACLAKQAAADEWVVSLRSKGAVDVGRAAVALGGGGHRFAAGFTGHGSVEQVLASVTAALADRSPER